MTKTPIKVLVIDDLRTFDPVKNHYSIITPVSIVYARDFQSAIELLSTDTFDHVWFDHDLGVDSSHDGHAVTLWLKERCFNGNKVPIFTCYVHTANPVGAKRLYQDLSDCGYRVVRIASKAANLIVL